MSSYLVVAKNLHQGSCHIFALSELAAGKELHLVVPVAGATRTGSSGLVLKRGTWRSRAVTTRP